MTDYGATFRDTLEALGTRAHALRVKRGLRQDEVASRAGVGVSTVGRFEQTGTASLENVLRIATALGADAGFAKLFEPPLYTSIDEALERPGKRRQRVRKR